jgi:putative copper export protein
MALGAWNWRVGTPALLRGDPGAATALRRTIAVELLLAAVVLGLTAWLVASPLPSHGG